MRSNNQKPSRAKSKRQPRKRTELLNPLSATETKGALSGPAAPIASAPATGYGRRRTEDSWSKTKFLDLMGHVDLSSYAEVAAEYLQRKRILDLLIAAGKTNAKIQDPAVERPLRVAFAFPQINDAEWEKIFSSLAERAVYLAMLLAGELSAEIDLAFEAAGRHLFPANPVEIRTFCDCGAPTFCAHRAALFYRLAEMVESDPFLIFSLRGRGRDETLLQIGKARAKLRRTLARSTFQAQSAPVSSPSLGLVRRDGFWQAGAELFQLSYSLRADELPAALLRQLDPIPLGLPEEIVEITFEDLYAQIARRAQGYGLGLRSGGSS